MKSRGVVALFVVLAVAAALVQETGAVDCVPTELLPCLGALSGGGGSVGRVLRKLQEQQPCFCEYLKNPQFKPYIDSPNARKIAAICAVAVPTC